jgi:CheY-like chemotaxis protein
MESLSDGKILVVDDVEANIDILVDALEEDYDVSVAMDGESALEAIGEDKPDLILLDIMMPGIDGYEVCKRIKQDPETEHIHIIFVTGVGETLQKSLGYQLGCSDYMTKPFDISEVKVKVKTLLSLVFFESEIARLKGET